MIIEVKFINSRNIYEHIMCQAVGAENELSMLLLLLSRFRHVPQILLSRTGYRICGAWYKMQIQSLLGN